MSEQKRAAKISSKAAAFVPTFLHTSKPFVPAAAVQPQAQEQQAGDYGDYDGRTGGVYPGGGHTGHQGYTFHDAQHRHPTQPQHPQQLNTYGGGGGSDGGGGGHVFQPSHVRHGETYPGAHARLGFTNNAYAQHYPALGAASNSGDGSNSSSSSSSSSNNNNNNNGTFGSLPASSSSLPSSLSRPWSSAAARAPGAGGYASGGGGGPVGGGGGGGHDNSSQGSWAAQVGAAAQPFAPASSSFLKPAADHAGGMSAGKSSFLRPAADTPIFLRPAASHAEQQHHHQYQHGHHHAQHHQYHPQHQYPQENFGNHHGIGYNAAYAGHGTAHEGHYGAAVAAAGGGGRGGGGGGGGSILKPAESPTQAAYYDYDEDGAYYDDGGGGYESVMRRADSPSEPVSFMKQVDDSPSGGGGAFTTVNPYRQSQSGDSGGEDGMYGAQPWAREVLHGGGGASARVPAGAAATAGADAGDDDDNGPTDAQYQELLFASMEEKAKASVVTENVGRYSSMAEFREKLLAAKAQKS